MGPKTEMNTACLKTERRLMWFGHYEINFIIQNSEAIQVCDENKTFKR